MNDMQEVLGDAPPEGAVRFTGNWREFLPIAFTNLLLTIVTLGIYRFWAKARERRYLWSRTLFIEDNLEWTGTGKEMFIGFLLVILIFLPVALLAQFAVEALLLRGETAGAALLGVTFYAALFYLIGVAKFRALRYRLSRTYWRGIRGGSEDRGWRFGVNFVWKTVVGIFLLGFLVPWAMTSLWNDRWNRMSFGQHEFDARADTDGLFGRWLFVYLVPVVGGVVGMTAAAGLAGTAPGTQPSSATLLDGRSRPAGHLCRLPARQPQLLCRLLSSGRIGHENSRTRIRLHRAHEGLAEAHPRQYRPRHRHPRLRTDLPRIPKLVLRSSP
jgi:uncharacterized membrane protein YjgN (DUF898 family)